MRWMRGIVGGLLAETLVIVLIAPVALVVGLDRLSDPSNIPPSIGYSVVIASFIGPLLSTQWVARPLSARFGSHGLLVGFAAFAVYMIPMILSGEHQPLVYWIAHAMKIAGGLAGGMVAARRHAARAVVTSAV